MPEMKSAPYGKNASNVADKNVNELSDIQLETTQKETQKRKKKTKKIMNLSSMSYRASSSG